MSSKTMRFLHRGRRVLARSVQLGRRAMNDMRTPTDVERLMDALPVVASAAPGLSGKVVAISGGTQGVGLAVARRFGELGAKIVVNGRRAEAVEGAVANLKTSRIEVQGVTADVGEAAGVQALIDGAVAGFGQLDILINNAAIAGPHAPVWDVSSEALSDTIRINLIGPMLATMAAIRYFRAAGIRGRVINLSSIATEGNYPRMMPYSTTKAGIEAFTRHVANDLADGSVVVTALLLPSVQTERKFAADWASTELLPPVESILPAFEFSATGPAGQMHGRTLSAARFITEPYAEAHLAGVAATRKAIAYPELKIDGRTVKRDPMSLVLLDRAENQQGTSPRVVEAVTRSLAEHAPNFYPDERFEDLRAALSKEHGLPAGSFALGPGSWELISRIVQIFTKPGEQVVSNGPGWFGFNLTCTRHGAVQTLVPLDRGDTGNRPNHNLGDVLAAITPRTRLVYLISPSNPEGVTLKHRELAEFLEAVPPDLPILIDEAYAEYSDDAEMADVPTLVREQDRSLIGLRTFSKFYGLAGMRVGYAYARPELADLIRRSEQIFTLSHVSAVAACAALGDRDHRTRVFEAARAARTQMQRGLDSIGLRHIESQAPYIFADAPSGFADMVEDLAKGGIVVAPYLFNGNASVMLPVGTTAQNERILDAVRSHR